MLESIDVTNFQSHKHTKLDLHPGINAVTGPSDAGKSAVFRAINWVIKNRPRGTAFQSSFIGKGSTEVSLDFDGTKVVRTKKGTTNKYSLGEEDFNTVKTNVPLPVSDFLKLDDINIQGQHEKYFQLQDSPGDVAKTINKIARLDIIDFCLKEVAGDSRKSKWRVGLSKEKIEEITEGLKAFEHLDAVEKILEEVADSAYELENAHQTHKELSTLIAKIKTAEEDVQIISDWLSVEEVATPIFENLELLEESRKSISELGAIISNVERTQEEIDYNDDFILIDGKVKDLIKMIVEYNKLDLSSTLLRGVIFGIGKVQKSITDWGVLIDELTKEATDIMKEHGSCPLCGGELSKDFDIEEHLL
jgi:DNA repair protein SbcC/Rad50